MKLRIALNLLWEAGKMPINFHVQAPDKSAGTQILSWNPEFAQEHRLQLNLRRDSNQFQPVITLRVKADKNSLACFQKLHIALFARTRLSQLQT